MLNSKGILERDRYFLFLSFFVSNIELKKEVMQKYYSGYAGTRILGKEYGIPQHTIDTWISMEKHGKNIYFESRKGMGGRKKEKDIDYKEQCEILKKWKNS